MAKSEKTSKQVAKTASKALRNPKSVTPKQIRSIAASALTQAPDKRKPVKRKR